MALGHPRMGMARETSQDGVRARETSQDGVRARDTSQDRAWEPGDGHGI